MILRVLLFLFLAGAVANAQQVRIGSIEYFGTKQIDVEKVKPSLPVHDGDTVTFDKFPDLISQVKDSIKASLGQGPTDIAPGCCDQNGNWFLYIGLPGTNVQTIRYNRAPRGVIHFPANVPALYQQFLDLNMEAVKTQTIEDRSQGYALSSYPALRAKQLAMREYAVHNPALIRRVLSDSADAEQRKAAAQLLGYANFSRSQIESLVKASRDPDETVRNNAVRALGVLAESSPAIARQIPAKNFIALLNSGEWTDRNKGGLLLSPVTADRDPKLLRLIRATALDSLIEMARWRDYGHAVTARILLGRIAGIEEKELQKLAQDNVEAIIKRVLN